MGNSCKIVCNYHKDRRQFSAKDAGRVICYAREGGASWQSIKQAASDRCGPLEGADCDCERLSNLIRLAETALALAVAIILVVATKGRAIKKARVIYQKQVERGITIEGEVIKDLKALEKASDNAVPVSENLQKVINELSLAQREAFAMREIVIKP